MIRLSKRLCLRKQIFLKHITIDLSLFNNLIYIVFQNRFLPPSVLIYSDTDLHVICATLPDFYYSAVRFSLKHLYRFYLLLLCMGRKSSCIFKIPFQNCVNNWSSECCFGLKEKISDFVGWCQILPPVLFLSLQFKEDIFSFIFLSL